MKQSPVHPALSEKRRYVLNMMGWRLSDVGMMREEVSIPEGRVGTGIDDDDQIHLHPCALANLMLCSNFSWLVFFSPDPR